MTDVNEELVRRYFEVQGYFVRTNVRYEYRTEKGMGWADIDLCVLHPVTGDAATVEIKGWHTSRITAGSIQHEPSLFHFVRKEALAAAETVLGRAKFKRILVLGQISDQRRSEIIDFAKQKEVEIIEFPEVLKVLIQKTHTNLNAGSESEHVIRVLKVYGFVKDIP